MQVSVKPHDDRVRNIALAMFSAHGYCWGSNAWLCPRLTLAREASTPCLFPKGPDLRSSRSRVRMVLIGHPPGERVQILLLLDHQWGPAVP